MQAFCFTIIKRAANKVIWKTNLTRRDFVVRETSVDSEDGPGSPCEFELRERFSLLDLDFESDLEESWMFSWLEIRLDDRLPRMTGLVSGSWSASTV